MTHNQTKSSYIVWTAKSRNFFQKVEDIFPCPPCDRRPCLTLTDRASDGALETRDRERP